MKENKTNNITEQDVDQIGKLVGFSEDQITYLKLLAKLMISAYQNEILEEIKKQINKEE